MACGLQLQAANQVPVTQRPKAPNAFSRDNILGAFTSRRVKLMIIAFIVELVLFLAFSAIPMTKAEYQAIVSSPGYQQINSVRSQGLVLRSLSIFDNNYYLASLEIIPVLGPIIFVYTTYSTARVLDALGYSSGLPGPLLFVNIVLFPHSWLELPAYAVAVTQSILLLYSLAKRSFVQEVARTIVVWLFVGLELFVAAIIESSIISLESYGLLQALLMWIPTLLIMYFGYRVFKRIQRPTPAHTPTSNSTQAYDAH